MLDSDKHQGNKARKEERGDGGAGVCTVKWVASWGLLRRSHVSKDLKEVRE